MGAKKKDVAQKARKVLRKRKPSGGAFLAKVLAPKRMTGTQAVFAELEAMTRSEQQDFCSAFRSWAIDNGLELD